MKISLAQKTLLLCWVKEMFSALKNKMQIKEALIFVLKLTQLFWPKLKRLKILEGNECFVNEAKQLVSKK